ncbi:hypothetical protein Q31b_38350 [Novipirellula aureliae]|uniref:Uncharacterized protein n=1 Tax=Novipirellula aureliae TaxID=2527966 RepID=A0A5C6DS89_9BACT|nr:hypothetical protein Q31b_38350 [Novipirellula aureliae]
MRMGDGEQDSISSNNNQSPPLEVRKNRWFPGGNLSTGASLLTNHFHLDR